MRLEYQIACAMVLDLLVGDPRWLPHPVRLIGLGAAALEGPTRRWFRNAKVAGIVTAVTVISLTALTVWATLCAAGVAGPKARDVVSILWMCFAFAARDLASHAMRVHKALSEDDLPRARNLVARMVGRDTACLDEHGVIRAVVESVAENIVDGVTAPLFFAFLGGPICVLAYKAISTLDSTFGYKNERYLNFGWASARIDDLAAYIPARLTLPFIALAAGLTGLHPQLALRYGWRDARKHASPNSGFSEAAAAGALGVQLGGPLYRQGRLAEAPLLGEPLQSLCRRHIPAVVRLMLMTALLVALGMASVRWLVLR